MRILIDECLPAALRETLAALDHECETVRRAGYGSKKKGELLSLAEGRWDVLPTSDRRIKYQQNMTRRQVHRRPARKVQSHEGFVAAHVILHPSPALCLAGANHRGRTSIGEWEAAGAKLRFSGASASFQREAKCLAARSACSRESDAFRGPENPVPLITVRRLLSKELSRLQTLVRWGFPRPSHCPTRLLSSRKNPCQTSARPSAWTRGC